MSISVPFPVIMVFGSPFHGLEVTPQRIALKGSTEADLAGIIRIWRIEFVLEITYFSIGLSRRSP